MESKASADATAWRLAARTSAVDRSTIRQTFDLAQGDGVVHLGFAERPLREGD